MAGSERRVFQWERKVFSLEKDFRVEGELALNPNYPPVERVLFSDLKLVNVESDLSTQGLFIKGMVVPSIVYAGVNESNEENYSVQYFKEEGLAGIEFNQLLDNTEIPPGARVELNCRILRGVVERQLHHSVRVEAEISVNAKAYTRDEQEMLIDAKAVPPGNLQVVKENISLEEYVGKFNGIAVLQNMLELDYPKLPVARVLAVQARPSGLRCEAQNNRIKLEGNLDVLMTYIASDDEGREGSIEMTEWGKDSLLRWQMDIEAPRILDDSLLLPRVAIDFVKAEPRGNEGIRLEAALRGEVDAYQTAQGEVIVDIGSHDMILDLNRKNVELVFQADSRIVPLKIESVVELPSGRPEIGKIVGYRSNSVGIKAEAEQGKYIVEGGVNLVATYLAADEERFPGLYSVSLEGPVSGVVWGESIDAVGVDDGMSIDISGDVFGVTVEKADGRNIRVTADAIVKLTASDSRVLLAVSDWAEIPAVLTAPRPSMVFYLTQPGDTLWKVARKYQTTMEALARENHLVIEDTLPINKRLIIPTVSSGKVSILR